MRLVLILLFLVLYSCQQNNRSPSSIPEKKEKFRFPEEEANRDPYSYELEEEIA